VFHVFKADEETIDVNIYDKTCEEFGNALIRDNIMCNNTDDDGYFMSGREDYWTFDASITNNSSRWFPEGMNWSVRLRRLRATNIFGSASKLLRRTFFS
jgi:hypothetical protein